MKHRNLWIGVLLLTLLLGACSGISSLAELPDETLAESPDVDPPDKSDLATSPEPQAVEEEASEPTPSSPFEQSYDVNQVSDRDYSEYEIVTLLPPDGIPALTNPSYYSIKHADNEYDPDEMVIGIEFNGDARAYSIGLLSSHEIVNDTIGGIHLAVTW